MSFLFSAVTNFSTATQNRIGQAATNVSSTFKETKIGKVACSMLGQKVIAATKENIVECLAYYGGAILAAPLGRAVGGAVLGTTGKAISLGLTLFGARKTTEIVCSKTTNVDSLKRALLCALNFSLISYLIHTTCFENFSLLGESVGGKAGEFLAYIGTGILSAFAGIKYCNSQEVLWDKNILQTYPFKTIQSLIFCALAEYRGYLPSNIVLYQLINLILGSLTYNILDIKKFAKELKNGTLLEGLNFDSPDLGAFNAFVYHSLEKSVDYGISSLPRLKSLVAPDAYKHTVGKIVIDHLQQALKKRLKSLIDINPLSTTLSTPNHLSKELINELAFYTVVRSCNLYFHLLSTYPHFFELYDEKPEEIQKTIFSEITKLSNSLGISRDPLKTLLHLDLERKGQLKSTIEKKLNPFFVSPEIVENMSKKIIDSISKMEIKAIGFELLSQKQKIEAQKTIEKHVSQIFKFAPLQAPTSVKTPSQDEIRQFYKNINSFSCNYYQPVIGKRSAHLVERVLNHQITNL